MSKFMEKVRAAFDFMSCARYTERVSREIDGELPWYEKPAFWVRTILCPTSRVFRRQMHTLQSLTIGFKDAEQRELNEERCSGPCLYRMSDVAKERISAQIEAESQREENFRDTMH